MKSINNNDYNCAANELYELYLKISNDCRITSVSNCVNVRILATTGEGHVYFDSRKGAPDNSTVANGNNNYASWTKVPPITGPLKGTISGIAISENHFTRRAFMDAVNTGVGCEVKPILNSNNIPVLESRYAVRYSKNNVEFFGVISLDIEELLEC